MILAINGAEERFAHMRLVLHGGQPQQLHVVWGSIGRPLLGEREDQGFVWKQDGIYLAAYTPSPPES